MSGGAFDYNQYNITDIYESIENAIKYNDTPDEWGYCSGFSEETINELKDAIKLLKKAQVYAHRIDWLLSGDDGEETFHKRLKEDLDKL